MTFLAPGFLLLLLLAPLAFVWPRRGVEPLQGALRAGLWVLLALALARPVLPGDEARTHHVVVDDTRGLVADARADAVRDAGDVWAALPDDARRTRVALGPTAVPGADPAPADARAADLGEALAVALRAVPPGARGAITLLTDGRSPAGGWARSVLELQRRGLPVHVVRRERPAGDLFPARLEPLGEVRVGATARVAVDVVGDVDAARVRLLSGDEELAASEPLAVDGRARCVLEFEPDRAGWLSLTAEVELLDGVDTRPGQERLTRTVPVQDPLRVLYLGGRTTGGATALGDLLGPGFDLVPAGSGGDSPGEVDLDPAAYDLVMVDDRPAAQVPAALQEEIVRAVQEGGTGLVHSGGEGAFGPGGWHEQPMTDLLPVECVQKEEKRDPSVTLVLIIDTSGSMGGNRVQLAKEVGRLALRRLLPHDKVGIVEFYGAKRWAAPIQPASNHIELERALNRMSAGGGTVILPAIEEAYYGLKNVQTRYKHVLVLTDGGVETGAFEPLLRRMSEDGITVSTVLIGPDAHSEFLVTLANWGKGRFYSVPNRFNLPEILLKQPASAKLPAYRPVATAVRARGGSAWWGDVERETLPDLSGHVETHLRPGAEVVVETVDGARPVLASWRHGAGRVTTFASEPVGAGTEGWRDWDGYGPLLARALRRTASDTRDPFRFSLRRDGDELVLRAERQRPGPHRPGAQVLAAAAADAAEAGVAPTPGEPLGLAFDERAPGVFEARHRLAAGSGPVRLLCGSRAPSGEGLDALAPRTRLGLDPPVPDALADPALDLDLERLAATTGGELREAGRLADFEPASGGGERPAGARDLRGPLALLALALYLTELFWRRRPLRAGRAA